MTSIPRAANPAARLFHLSSAGLLIAGLTLAACGERPRVASAQQAQPAETAIRAYRVPPEQLDSVANQLRAQWAGRADVRVASDPRSGQIIVQGPLDVQQSVAARLAQLQGPAATGGVRSDNRSLPHVPAAAPRSATASSVVNLRHHAARDIEESLLALFGQRLTTTQSRELGATSYLLNGNVRIDVQQQTNRVTLNGPTAAVDGLTRLIQAWDTPDAGPERITRTVAMERSSPNTAQRLASALAASDAGRQARVPMVTVLFQREGEAEGAAPTAPAPDAPPPAAPNGAQPGAGNPLQPQPQPGPANGAAPAQPGQPAAGTTPPGGGMIGPVQVEMLEGLDVLVLRGHQRDVERVLEVIEQIEQLSAETEPLILVYRLRHVDCGALTELIAPLYDQIYALRQGFVSINALVKPNALLLIGRRESVQTVLDLVKKLDRPVDPETQFRVFQLRHAAALAAQQAVLEFYAARGGLGPRVRATADFRSNALVVQASPRDMLEIAALIERLDTPTSAAVNELRVVRLENSLAEELAPILQAAVSGQSLIGRTATAPGVPPAAAQQPGGQQRAQDQKSMMLRFVTVDTKGQRKLESGILTDVRITADTRANALLVSAPAESMELIEALIHQLDKLPAAEAQIKVFTIVNGDATSLAEMLQALFARAQTGPTVQLGAQLGSVSGENQIVTLRFAVDVRTNSIIASGTPSDLQVVEAILLRLDDSDVRHRRSVVYRLKNAPATDVATAINQFLQTERQVQQVAPGLLSPFEQIEREVVVVPEPVSNSLIVSATPRYFDEIKKIVEELDQRPPMVMIQVLIAEVALNKTDEFGVELGLQDSILFDRSLLGNITTLTRTTYDQFGNPVATTQDIASATYTPGFAFNNQPLGQSSGTGTSGLVGTQGLSHFSLGRTNNDLGFGGLVLTASSESVSVLIRALKECRKLEVLSRPQVMTLDNQPAFIQVGQRVPRIVGTTVNQTAQVNNITLENVGLIMGVTPRISPEGLIVMEIDAEKSEVGPEAEGIPVSISATGQVIRSPRINTITAQTTVSAANGQTIVLGGLINRRKAEFHRKVPLLGDIPVLGYLFRYDGVSDQKAELLIIMTPHIVRTEADAERIKRLESSRMHWCLGDVLAMHGTEGGRRRTDNWSDAETAVVYPDTNPAGIIVPNSAAPGAWNGEFVPTPAPQGQPSSAPSGTMQPPSEPPAAPQEPVAPLGPQGSARPSTRHDMAAVPPRPIIASPRTAASPAAGTQSATQVQLRPSPGQGSNLPNAVPGEASGQGSGPVVEPQQPGGWPTAAPRRDGQVQPAAYQDGSFDHGPAYPQTDRPVAWPQPAPPSGYSQAPQAAYNQAPPSYTQPGYAAGYGGPVPYGPPAASPPAHGTPGYAPPGYGAPSYAPPDADPAYNSGAWVDPNGNQYRIGPAADPRVAPRGGANRPNGY